MCYVFLSRFEEIHDTVPTKAGQKRPREDDMDEDEDEAKKVAPTKSQKKLNKKLKVENGDAVPVGASSTDKKVEKKGEASGSSPETSKKESKEKKKEHKKEKKEKKKEEKQEKKQTTDAPTASTNAGSPSKKTLAGGLVIEDSKVGSGKTAKAGSLCAMRYIGKLTDGTIFDSNTKGKVVSVQEDKMDKSVVFTVFAVHV